MPNNVFQLDNIRTIHVELTDRCNAACPMCVRNINGGPDNPYLPKKEVTLDLFKNSFSVDFLKQIELIYFCGNYGDPILARDLIPILEYIREKSPKTKLGMNSNAGAGSPNLWRRLGGILSQEGDYCFFSIDGLHDTNHIHRRNVKWDHVMKSAQSFISGGGRAKWDYLVFKHNEHQIDEARNLSKSLGFQSFHIKKTGRFFYFQNEIRIEAFPVYSKNLDFEYYLEPASTEELRNKTLNMLSKEENIQIASSYVFPKKFPLNLVKNDKRKTRLKETFFIDSNEENKYVSSANIRCRVMEDNSIFISSEGMVFPCCWTAYPLNTYWDNNDSLQLRGLIEDCGGLDSIDLNKRSLKEIVEGTFFKAISSSWDKPCAKEGKLVSCANQCGTNYEKLSDENVHYKL